MSDWDHTSYMLMDDDAHAMRKRQTQTEATPSAPPPIDRRVLLKAAFADKAKGGASLMIHGIQNFYPAFDESFMMPGLIGGSNDVFIPVYKNEVPKEKLEKLLNSRDSGDIVAVYDLRKPFDQARGDAALLSEDIKAAIRDLRYERIEPQLRWWQRVALAVSSDHREKFKQSIYVVSPIHQ